MHKIAIDNNFLNKQYQIHRILALMWIYSASDMIFIPLAHGVKIKLKKNYKTIFLSKDLYDYEYYNRLINLIILGTSLRSCSKEPQSSQFNFTINNTIYGIRVSIQESLHNKTLCFRLLQNCFFNVKNFNLDSSIIQQIEYNPGLNIIAGRTCSGKTSLLYGILHNSQQHIITMEDPIESHMDNIIQTDVSNIGYEAGCKSVLRQNPDIIVIGEIRDPESAQAAIRCALTGHNVIATLHANSPNEILLRFDEFGCKYYKHILKMVIFLENFRAKVVNYQKKGVSIYT